MSNIPIPEPLVDAMLAIYVHDPDVLLTDLPSGGRIAAIAREALVSHDPTLAASDDCYVRAVVTNDVQPIADQEKQARTDAPDLIDGVLRERGLQTREYEHDVWTEELSPKISVVWIAARRSNQDQQPA